VEKALVAVHVADLGVGDGNVVQAGRNFDQLWHASSVRPWRTVINVDSINVDEST
jgi:hypothetical protein